MIAPAQAGTAAMDTGAASQCLDLADADFSAVQDVSVEVVSAELVTLPGSRLDLCHLEVKVAPKFGFEVFLPRSRWNGKLLAYANVVNDYCASHLEQGYACVQMYRNGKPGRTDVDAFVQFDLLDRLEDAFRGHHSMALAGKAIVNHFYHRAPERSYLVGCSAGGYAGLVEAQTFPWDFDGIVAGAPGVDSADWLAKMLWAARNSLDAEGRPIFQDADRALLHRGVLAACDRDDGLADAIVSNPMGCRFQPVELLCGPGEKTGCLSRAQVTAATRIYEGPTTSTGRRLSAPSVLRGSELAWKEFEMPEADVVRFLNYVLQGATLNPEAKFDFDRDYPRLGSGVLFKFSNPDLRQFKSLGGKVLAYQGTTDVSHVAGAAIDYYQTVEKTMGGRQATQDFFRLFMVPGMDHCSGGVGADAADFLRPLEAWVERGRAPDRIVSGHLKTNPTVPVYPYRELPADPAALSFTRPLYPYPQYARYRGNGDPNDASSFERVEP
jgi:feruloyl esterase